MAFTFGFYNSVEGDRKYDAIQISQIFDGIIKDGVYGTYLKGMVVKASSNASEVIVQPGRAWFNHTWSYVDADYPIEAPLPEVILDRVDALVLDINSENAVRANDIIWVTGEPSSQNPARPTLTNTVTHHQYALAYVYRKAGTTMIYTADITNVIGTSETPFVTGVLEGIDLDAWINQWDDEFHTWENATKASFEGWMVTQQSVYTAWYNSIKSQMESDLSDFNDWFITIQGIIDSEAATHLQSEIDDLAAMLPAGSHITITTTEASLYSRDVIVRDIGGHEKTARFDGSGIAVVESFPYVGTLTITSTDGERTATKELVTPYFGRYSVAIAFWSATVNIDGSSALAGTTVTVKNSSDVTVTSVILNAEGFGVFNATYPDTYKFSYIYGGQTMEVSLAVTQETTYNVEIHGGFNYNAWLTAGRVSGSFSSLDEILADEATLRQLFLVHDSVDYLAGSSVNSDVEKIFNTDLAAKWINLSDYALDTFYAVSDIKTVMDEVDKYGYGEWCLMPQVPVMTSNTAPYGEAIRSGVYNSYYEAYCAFNGVTPSAGTGNYWAVAFAVNVWIGYKFVNPICVRKVSITNSGSAAPTENVKSFVLQGSNDGSTWTDISSTLTISDATTAYKVTSFDVTNNAYYLQYRILVKSNGGAANLVVGKLQFYAWAPKGNVPVMTSNTAPYGEVSVSSTTSTHYGWKVFDRGNTSGGNYWYTANGEATKYIQYKSVNPICVKRVMIESSSSGSYITPEVVLKGSNDGNTWDTIGTISISMADCAHKEANVTNSNYYLYHKLEMSGTTKVSGAQNNDIQINELQFYGRELSVSVPVMTSNTAPFGEAIRSSIESSTYEGWKAFDGNDSSDSSSWSSDPSGIEGQWLGFDFGRPVVLSLVKTIYFGMWSNIYRTPKKYKIQGSNDGTAWADLADGETNITGAGYPLPAIFDEVSTSNEYRYFRLYASEKYTSGTSIQMQIYTLQFYGKDYSEKEFEAGTTKKWLYDHGLELETLETRTGSATTGGVVKQNNQIVCTNSSANNYTNFAVVLPTSAINFTPYTVAAYRTGDCESSNDNYTGFLVVSPNTNFPNGGSFSESGFLANLSTPTSDTGKYGQNPRYLNVSAINQSSYLVTGVGYGPYRKVSITELWLE